MKQLPYCLPILDADFSNAVKTIRNAEKDYRYFELWIDYLDPLPQPTELQILAKELGERLIFVFRRLELAPTKLRATERKDLLKLIETEPVWIDFDLTTQAEEIPADSDTRARKLISYHNYQQTPDNAELSALVEKMKSYKPQMLKIATYCNSPVDALRLLALRIGLNPSGTASIVLGMGPEGQCTRIFGSIWGNALIFAPQELSSATASGQLTRDAYERVFAELGVSLGR